jgi:hypothetical protein
MVRASGGLYKHNIEYASDLFSARGHQMQRDSLEEIGVDDTRS